MSGHAHVTTRALLIHVSEQKKIVLGLHTTMRKLDPWNDDEVNKERKMQF